MRLQLLLAMLLGLAMSLAPLAMPASAAPVPVSGHHQAMTSAEHCPDQPQPDTSDPADKSCCAAGCMAVAALPARAAEPAPPAASLDRPAPDRFRFAYLGETATPPPRGA